ncbi:MAG: hypothetical protein IJP17_05345 [Clostridia bacterium]|nr:hypothetical protein [Clostridia bacterium]
MKAMKMLIIYLICAFPIIAACFIMIASGAVSISYSGFALDSAGVLYIGTDTKIEKYYGGEMIGAINPQTSRGYAFTIQNDDTILLSTASTVYTLDLSGNVLDKQEDVGTRTFNELQKSKRYFITQDNREYVMKSQLGRTIISSDGDIIYQMPMMDYVVKIALVLVGLSCLVFAPIIVIKWRKCSG